jgi:hypothetical protein
MQPWSDGWRRVLAAPSIVGGVFVATLLAALPLALTMRGLIDTHLGRSAMADRAADGVNYDWWQEFASQASEAGARSLGTTFTPSVIGFAATLDNVSSLLDARPEILPVAGAIATYLVIWTFLTGGILDRYARQRATRAHGFFSAAGVFFWRFLRLAAIAAAVYWFLFTYVHGWLFDDLYTRMTRNIAVERDAFLWRLGCYLLFTAALAFVTLVFDYARVRAVVEDRRSAVGALAAALAFIGRHPGRVLGLYALNTLTFMVVIGIWAGAAPGAGGAGRSLWLGLLGSQVYVLGRLLVKLQFLASQTALFQGLLAHASYTAAPAPVWPESPASESIRSG